MFRHGGMVRADRCEDMGAAIGYLQFGGWVVVPKSMVASVEDEAGVHLLNPRWTSEEQRAQLRALPEEGGVPVAPAITEAPTVASAPPPQPVYVPVPVPSPPQEVYEEASPAYVYPVPFAVCRHCRPHPHPKPPFVRVVPTNPSDIGPMAIQKTFPPITPLH